MNHSNVLRSIKHLIQKPGKDKTKIGPVAVYKACNKEIARQKCEKIAAIIRSFPPEEAIASIKLTLLQGNSALQWIMVSPGSAIPSSSRKLSKHRRRTYKNSKKQEAVRNAPLNLIDGWPFCLLPPSDYFSD
ncbi:3014_t:CDS:2 [Cetraspora pellucida]|uniref:3014_t:CDS:1 n=1 Tax=Cetraspora pellucida TaxID=1433469 RepID=A0A9N9HUI0_9GLOM|nr:3014_t:CDS:2 [Cetraspora pellucida]